MKQMTVGIVMGSDSDWPVMKEAALALDELGVEHELARTTRRKLASALY